jgi:hypothetical protein
MTIPGRAVSCACVILTASCAAVWGFDDAELGDAGGDARVNVGRDARADASRDARADAGHDAAADTMARDAGSMDHAVAPPDADDTGVRAGKDTAPPPVCLPMCQFGATCAEAVGGTSVCVSMTCTDSTQCISGCCVWLDSSSASGSCQAPGPPPMGPPGPGVSCLCMADEMRACKSCGKPPGYPAATVTVCKGP